MQQWSPVAIDKDDVDPKIIEHEMEIGREQARTEGKAENMLDKMPREKSIGFLQRKYFAKSGFRFLIKKKQLANTSVSSIKN